MMGLPINKIICGDCRVILRNFPPKSIDMIMFSPPYWGQRDYGKETETIWGGNQNCEHDWQQAEITFERERTDEGFLHSKQFTDKGSYAICLKCGAIKVQLGLEPHPQMYIDHLVEICRELRRVLKDTGSLWINIGDKYFGPVGWWSDEKWLEKSRAGLYSHTAKINKVYNQIKDNKWLQPKQLMLIPSRFAIAMQEEGWILRNDIIWFKPNSLPSSANDRLNDSYEHLFHFVKQRKYYYNLDAIKKPYKQSTIERARYGSFSAKTDTGYYRGMTIKSQEKAFKKILSEIDKGAVPKDVWRISLKPFSLYWCPKCNKLVKQKELKCLNCGSTVSSHFAVYPPQLCIKPILATCPEDGVVLDPMCGAGTTCLVAIKLNRNFIGIDINPEYCNIARERIRPYVEQKKILKYVIPEESITFEFEDEIMFNFADDDIVFDFE
jgi:site-specific DNA-methyltransferase (cytosine-N4-specific)